jgi:hypothetical protein
MDRKNVGSLTADGMLTDDGTTFSYKLLCVRVAETGLRLFYRTIFVQPHTYTSLSPRG